MSFLFINNELIRALAWTFVHSLWQGLIAALLVTVIFSLTRKTAASIRYNLLGSVLLLFIFSSVITFLQQINTASELPVNGGFVQSETGNLITADGSYSTSPVVAGWKENLGDWFNANANFFLILWLIFFALNCLKLLTGLAAVQRLRYNKVNEVSAEWKQTLGRLKIQLGIHKYVALLESQLVKVPLAIGYFKPVILIPAGMIARIPAEQVETILLHELAHIRRKDYLVNFLQHIAESIYFFNPALLWISSLLRQEREACCDDIVIAYSSSKRNYLDALVSFQEYSNTQRSYAMGISNRKQYLLSRVKRILLKENQKISIVEKLTLLLAVLIFSAFTFIRDAEKQELGSALTLDFNPAQLQSVSGKLKPVLQNTLDLKFTSQAVQDTIPLRKDSVIEKTIAIEESKQKPQPSKPAIEKVKPVKEWEVKKDNGWKPVDKKLFEPKDDKNTFDKNDDKKLFIRKDNLNWKLTDKKRFINEEKKAKEHSDTRTELEKKNHALLERKKVHFDKQVRLKLDEIQIIKDEIGLLKDQIGNKKIELNSEKVEVRTAANKEINEKRTLVNEKRKVLEVKRAELEQLKKEGSELEKLENKNHIQLNFKNEIKVEKRYEPKPEGIAVKQINFDKKAGPANPGYKVQAPNAPAIKKSPPIPVEKSPLEKKAEQN